MHDNSEAAGKRDSGLRRPRRFAILSAQVFSAKLCLARVRIELVQQLANGAVPLLGDPARPVELARLVPPGNQPEVGAGRP